jgi:TRAP-type C4-dicarboxylate transport system substrate-binding protein
MVMIKTMGRWMLAAAASTFLVSNASAETLKWGEHLPQCCSMYAAAAEWLKNEVNERSGGDLQFDINYGGVLATVGEIPTAIETGVIDMGNLVTPYFPDQFVINNAIPFFWPQPKSQQELGELMIKWHEEVPAFGEELARYNLKLITVRPLPPYGLICTQPIRTLEDFKGKRVRSYGVALPAMLEALGAVSVGLPDVEAYEAMSNNILDCSTADIALVDAFKLQEVGKYFIDVPMGASWGHIIVMNLDRYNGLSDDHKALLEELKTDHLTEMLALFRAKEDELKAAWAAEGAVEIIEFPAEEFLEATLGNAGVQAVQASWKTRAVAAGMSEADATRVVDELQN